MAEKFVTFDEAAKELKKTPDELKALVDEGKIRSFMDGGKMKFRRKDFDDLKASLGIVSEDDDLSLAPPDEVPAVPPMATEGVPPAPAAPKKAASLEDEFTIEPIDEDASPMAASGKKAPAPPKAAAKPAGGEEDEVASLSDFEISEDVEEKGQEIGDEEAELLSVQAPAGSFRSFDEPQQPNVLLTVVLVASVVVIAFTAVTIMSFAWGVDIESLSSLWSK